MLEPTSSHLPGCSAGVCQGVGVGEVRTWQTPPVPEIYNNRWLQLEPGVLALPLLSLACPQSPPPAVGLPPGPLLGWAVIPHMDTSAVERMARPQASGSQSPGSTNPSSPSLGIRALPGPKNTRHVKVLCNAGRWLCHSPDSGVVGRPGSLGRQLLLLTLSCLLALPVHGP